MKRAAYFSILFAVLFGTATYLVRRERRALPLREQLAAERALAGSDSLVNADSSLKKPAAEEKKSLGALATPVLPDSHEALQGDTSDSQSYLKAAPLSAKEIASARTLIGTFFRGDRGKAGLNRFIRDLQTAGLEPVIAKDENPYTGKMLVVRTKEALEGTRYMHAQFFQDESSGQEPFRQHLSFEIRPSPNSVSVAKQLIEAAAGRNLGKPSSSPTDQWVEWKMGAQSVWIQRLGKDDIANDPFNAHTSADVGTVRVAIEMIPDESHRKADEAHVR